MPAPKQFCDKRRNRGAVLATALISMLILFCLVASVFIATSSRFPASYQTNAWQDARMAAESGISMTLSTMCSGSNANAQQSLTSNWPGWKLTDGTTSASGADLIQTSTNAFSSNTYKATQISGISAPIYSGTAIMMGSGTAAYVNVKVDAFWPMDDTGLAMPPWFRIRSMGTVPIFGPARTGFDKLDTDLRRINTKMVRSSLQSEAPSALWPSWWDKVTGASTVPTASRVFEAIACPVKIMPFDKAIKANNTLVFGNSYQYFLDSYNSKYTSYPYVPYNQNPPNHMYPGQPSPYPDVSDPNYNLMAHANGADIATNSNADPAISTNNSQIYGDADTGPDGTVQNPQNILGADGITHDFHQDLPVYTCSTVGAHPYNGANDKAITPQFPVWVTNSDPGSITFSGSGNVTLVINSSWNLGNGYVRVPPNVHARIFVSGNIVFGGNPNVNMNPYVPPGLKTAAIPADSYVPGNLIIYGTGPAGSTFTSSGTPQAAALFYFPNYDVIWNGGGNGQFCGSVVSNSFLFNGGGGAAFHYDEASSKMGSMQVSRYVVSSFCEDYRR